MENLGPHQTSQQALGGRETSENWRHSVPVHENPPFLQPATSLRAACQQEVCPSSLKVRVEPQHTERKAAGMSSGAPLSLGERHRGWKQRLRRYVQSSQHCDHSMSLVSLWEGGPNDGILFRSSWGVHNTVWDSVARHCLATLGKGLAAWAAVCPDASRLTTGLRPDTPIVNAKDRKSKCI